MPALARMVFVRCTVRLHTRIPCASAGIPLPSAGYILMGNRICAFMYMAARSC